MQPETFLPLKSDVMLILMALADRPRHGYAIIRDVEVRSDGRVLLQTGALYRTLRRLLQDGLIAERPAPRDADSADERRRYYEPTRLGRAVLDAELARLARLVRGAARRRPGLA